MKQSLFGFRVAASLQSIVSVLNESHRFWCNGRVMTGDEEGSLGDIIIAAEHTLASIVITTVKIGTSVVN